MSGSSQSAPRSLGTGNLSYRGLGGAPLINAGISPGHASGPLNAPVLGAWGTSLQRSSNARLPRPSPHRRCFRGLCLTRQVLQVTRRARGRDWVPFSCGQGCGGLGGLGVGSGSVGKAGKEIGPHLNISFSIRRKEEMTPPLFQWGAVGRELRAP